ncbi:MAG TPA: translation initiation factor IF-2 subunit beta [Candidatus Thermoplasmatota archaeon]
MGPAVQESEYLEMLERAKAKLPKDVAEHERFQLPEADILYEGKSTVLRNFKDIVDVLRRDTRDVTQYMLREIGIAGSHEDRRLVFNGRVTRQQVDDKLQAYVATYVMCSECNRPDTHLGREGRTLILKCEACGAHRPIRVKRAQPQKSARPTLEEGKIYEFTVEDIGGRGDGVARKEGFTVFIPGTAKGSVVRAYVEKVTGHIAFAKIVRE